MLPDLLKFSPKRRISIETDDYLLAPLPPYKADVPKVQFTSSNRRSRWILSFQSLVIIILAASLIKLRHDYRKEGGKDKCTPKDENLQIYSPVSHLLRYENVTFTEGFDRPASTYQGPPTPERDQAWEDLYNFGVSKIPRSSAAKLVSKTLPLPGDPDNYVIQLQVFHSLHCLNVLRRYYWTSLEASFTPDDSYGGVQHIDHCIDDLRQYLMCAVDITPIPYKWKAEKNKGVPFSEITHTCWNFGIIKEWGLQNWLERFDPSEWVEADFKGIVPD